MKTIGIITGAGPEAGIDLFKKIIDEKRRILNGNMADIEAPSIVVFSVPLLGLAMDIKNREQEVWDALRETYITLAKHAELICIACNVLHKFVPRLRDLNLGSEIVSIVETAEDYIKNENLKKIGLLSISSVITLDENSPYKNLKAICQVVTPESPEIMDELVHDIKKMGIDSPLLGQRLQTEIHKLDVSTVLLACTELPLISFPIASVNQVDATLLLAQELVRRAE